MLRTLGKLFVATAILVLSAGLAMAQSAATVQVQSANGVNYLTDGSGLTLYYFTLDTTGQSKCYGDCAKAWPIFSADSSGVTGQLSPSDFGTITRTDGTSQSTYHGWPLYYWYQDKAAGDMKGEAVHDVWFVVKVPAYTVMIATSKAAGGNYLVDGSGKTLYFFTKDSAGTSTCTGGCLAKWPAFSAQSVQVPSELAATDFSSITRADGTAQTTYKGFPLYYYAADTNRGDATGQGFRNVWYVVNPKSFPPPAQN